MELEPPTWCRTLEHHVGGFERGGNFPSQSGKVARFRAIHTSACHLFTPGQPLQTFHSAMESFHLVQIRRHEVGGLEHGVGGANALSANNSTDTELESPTWSWGLEHVVGPSNITLEGLNEVETFHRRVEKLHDFGPFTPRVAICSHLGKPVETFHSAMESFHLVQIRQQGVGTRTCRFRGPNSLSADLNEVETFHRRVESLRGLPRCEQMATRSVNGPKSCNFSTLRWKVSTSFKLANTKLEGRTTCPTLQLLVGDGPNLTVHGKNRFFLGKNENPILAANALHRPRLSYSREKERERDEENCRSEAEGADSDADDGEQHDEQPMHDQQHKQLHHQLFPALPARRGGGRRGDDDGAGGENEAASKRGGTDRTTGVQEAENERRAQEGEADDQLLLARRGANPCRGRRPAPSSPLPARREEAHL